MEYRSLFSGKKDHCMEYCFILTFKVPITAAADDNFLYIFFILQRKQVLTFHVNCLLHHKMSRLFFSEK